MAITKTATKKKTVKKPIRKNDALIERILDYITYDGLSLTKACEIEGLRYGTFFDWLAKDSDLADKYARACSIRHEKMADEILDIADSTTEDDIYTADGNRVANAEWIARSRLRIDSRKWLLSKLLPKKYGEKVEIENKGEINHTVEPIIINFNPK